MSVHLIEIFYLKNIPKPLNIFKYTLKCYEHPKKYIIDFTDLN